MTLTRLQWAGLAGAALAAAGLLAALGSETYGGLVPCALCLLERWPYRAAVLFGALGLLFPRAARPMVALAALSMLAAALLGGLHVGVEQGAWPSPLPECAAPNLGGGTIAERLARMPATPAKPCDDPTYLIPAVPLSMAEMNLIYATVLFIGLGAVALQRRSTS